MNRLLNVALIKPPIIGHLERGTGVYTKQLLEALYKCDQIKVQLVEYKSNTDSFDLIHYPYFDPFFLTLPRRMTKPFIVTVHDLIPLKFPQHFTIGIKGEIKWKIQRHLLKRANGIITDSFASSCDIKKYVNIAKEKIKVIYLGVEDKFQKIDSKEQLKHVQKKLQLPKHFILHVGDVNYNKNIMGIIQGFSHVKNTIPDISLVFLGQGFIKPSKELGQILELIIHLQLEKDIYRIGRVSQEELISLYNLADMYLQPSLSEGFGLPVLEAMACGAPVVVSNKDSLKEIIDNCAVIVDPDNYTDIGRKTIALLKDNNKRQELSKKGIQNAKKYTWDHTATETIKVYKSIV